ncbi:hypothetical protein FNV43_RR16631 [Rhamnella rubrinervis]|uniref:Uncharacterized protein n=1 Tax=Rhamnella rubrinervis TaxID=2594499 RepID=A0A8K0MCB5_9ROSA|nr:hypothetical protein FNV43_RR16631 [Rhamnella rubrinervis]
MWQALLAAAVAGSTGLVAKHLFKPSAEPTSTTSVPGKTQKLNDGDHCEDQDDGVFDGPFDSQMVPYEGVGANEEGIFRFSSSGTHGGSSGYRVRSRKVSKKAAVSGRGLKKGVGNEGSTGVEQRKNGRRFGACLKKRRTGKNVAGNYGSRLCNEHKLDVVLLNMPSPVMLLRVRLFDWKCIFFVTVSSFHS